MSRMDFDARSISAMYSDGFMLWLHREVFLVLYFRDQ
jgi:hypothetical protein